MTIYRVVQTDGINTLYQMYFLNHSDALRFVRDEKEMTEYSSVESYYNIERVLVHDSSDF